MRKNNRVQFKSSEASREIFFKSESSMRQISDKNMDGQIFKTKKNWIKDMGKLKINDFNSSDSEGDDSKDPKNKKND